MNRHRIVASRLGAWATAALLLALVLAGASSLQARATKFYAVCQTDHVFWSGQERSTYKAAQADADNHNNANHGGREYAWVAND